LILVRDTYPAACCVLSSFNTPQLAAGIFIISLSAEQLFLDAPIIAVVEAKKENMVQGIPQCIAEMKAAQIFNEKKGNRIDTLFGVVTTGIQWQFLKLIDDLVSLDLDQYYIKELGKILGILHFMCHSQKELENGKSPENYPTA
jgi:hypothetical protein